jgi:hypothetical protein
MVWDPTTAALLGAVISGVVAIVAVVVQQRFESRRTDSTWLRTQESDRRSRLREWNLRRIEETRNQLIDLIDEFSDAIKGPRWIPRLGRGRTRRQLLANAALVGDVDAIQTTAHAIAGILGKVPSGRIHRAYWAISWPFDAADRAALEEARGALLNALERQQENVLRDSTLHVLSVADIQAAIDRSGLQAELDRLGL